MNSISAVSNVIATEYTERTETPVNSNAARSTPDFSAMLAEAMREEVTRVGVTAGGGLSSMPVGYMPMQNQGIEQMILAAASSGQVNDAQIALFMLCMMMQSNQDGEFPMLMQMMASMLTQIQGDTGALRSNVMSSDYDPYILDTIDRDVFNTSISSTIGTGSAAMPLEHWKPTIPVITCSTDTRSPERYRAVINQFNVENAERYRPFRNGSTYCNIFVWDVSRAMGAEVPMYTDPSTGEPRYYPDIKGARSMGAIAMCNWLSTHGANYGWREVDAETAQRHANQGKPAITSAGSLGHVQMICPSKDGGFDPIRGVTIAQAGRIVSNYTHISSIYGGSALNNSVRYWVHD